MIHTPRNWLSLAGASLTALAVAGAGVIGLSDASAGADPYQPLPPTPVTVTSTMTATPVAQGMAQPPAQALSQPAVTPPQASPLAGSSAAQPGAPAADPATPTLVPATSGSLNDYFKSKGVTLQPQKAQDFKALGITLPMPAGWSQVPDPNVPDAFVVIANRNSGDLYAPNAQVVVYKLVGNFDPNDAITHGFIDAQQQLAWQTTNATLADVGGFPSSLIEGTYRSGDSSLNTSQRHIIATVGPDRYLVSLAVTTSVAQAVALAPTTDAIVNGFRVTAPTPGPPPASTPALTPGLTPALTP